MLFCSPMRTMNGQAAPPSAVPSVDGSKAWALGKGAIAEGGTWNSMVTALPPKTCIGLFGWKVVSTGVAEKGSRSLTWSDTVGR